MTSTEVGLRRIKFSGDEITGDHPRYLACVEIAVVCTEMGMALFSKVKVASMEVLSTKLMP